MGMVSRIKARRAARKEKRTARPQYYGGSAKEAEDERVQSKADIDAGRASYGKADKNLSAVGNTAMGRENDANSDYRGSRNNYNADRSATQAAISGIGSSANDAIAARNSAIAASPTMTQSANSLLAARSTQLAASQAQQAQAAQARLGQSIGANNRAALGMAAGAGESGALGIQQAIATGAQGGADALADNNIKQNELLAQQGLDSVNVGLSTGLTAAGADRDALLQRAATDQAMRYDAANQTATQQQALLGASQANLGQTDSRQQNFLTTRAGVAGTSLGAAGSMVGQDLNNLQTINGSELGANQANDATRLASNKANTFMARTKNFLGGALDAGGLVIKN
jgi:hypothetical protein